MTELENPEILALDPEHPDDIAAAIAATPEGLTLVSADFAAGEWQYDGRRKQEFRRCAELVGGRWEGFVSLRGGRAS